MTDGGQRHGPRTLRPLLVTLAVAALLALGWLGSRAAREASTDGAPVGAGADRSSEHATQRMPAASADAAARAPSSELPREPEALAGEPSELALCILDPEGLPVAGAAVELWPGDAEDAAGHHTADADGHVRITTTIDPASYFAEASAPGVGRSGKVRLRVQRKDAEGAYEITLSALGAVAGVVLGADGLPVSGADVTARFRGQRFGAGTPRGAGPVRSDASGRFRLELLGGCTFELAAERFGARTRTVKARVEGGAETEVVLRFGGESRVAGRVIAPDGAPAPGATVHLWELLDADAATDAVRLETNCDALGAFTFELFHGGEFLLLATSEEHASSEPAPMQLETGVDRTGLTLQLVPAAEIAGRVLDAAGEPLADVVVGAQRDGLDPSFALHPRGVRTEWYDGAPLATTDAHGRFRLTPVRPGTALYAVICAPYPEQRGRWAYERGVRAGTTDVELVITEERLRRAFVHGRVTQEGTDEPPERLALRLSYERPNGSWSHERPRELKPVHGEYLCEGLEPGLTYVLCVYQHSVGLLVRTETFVASLDGTRFDLELPKSRPVELQVAPVAASARPPRQITLESVLTHPAGPDPRTLPLDRHGVAHLPLPPGTYVVRRPDDEDTALEFRVRAAEGLQVVRID